jgi:DNA-binding MarR family transcriptional regulator
VENEEVEIACVARECLAVRVRLLNRAVTRIYDDALRPLGARVGQMNILVAAAAKGDAKPADLCRTLQMDKSTLSRDIDRLLAAGWLESVPGEDARTHTLRVTPKGLKLIRSAAPAWRKAQARTKELLGEAGVNAVSSAARKLWVAAAK